MRTLALLLVALAAAPCGCGEPEPSAPTWPAGTAIVLGGQPITVAEVDAHVDAVLDIQPSYSLEQRRRIVLMNWSFPRALGAAEGGARRSPALEEARAWRAGLLDGTHELGEASEQIGNWDMIGFEIWLVARDLEVGEASEPVELPGRYAVLRLEQRDGNPRPAFEYLRVRVAEFPFVDDPEALLTNETADRLEIVDPAWAEIVPGIYKY